MVLVPAYGSPFIRNLEEGRRYATIEDFRNFVKLSYMTPYLHHSGGTVCEPVDVPVNKRHFDMVYSHMRYSDKPFMGSVTAPERAQDTVEMAKILFGEEFLESNTVITSLINANSPMVWDSTMLGALKAYARSNQATVISPFCISGAMSPVTVAATAAQLFAEALSGMAFVQLVRPGAPVPCLCSPVLRHSGLRNLNLCFTSLERWHAGLVSHFVVAEDYVPRRFQMRRPLMKQQTRYSTQCWQESISCCTQRDGLREDCPWATRNSLWTWTRQE